MLRGLRWEVATRLAYQGLSLVVLALVARILDPADFGAAAVVTVLSTLPSIVAERGVGAALVRSPILTAGAARTVHRQMLRGSAVVGGVLLAAAPLVDRYLADGRRWVGVSLAVLVAVQTLSVVARGRVMRQRQFRAQGLIKLAGEGAVYAVVVVPAALLLEDHRALLLSQVVAAVAVGVASMVVARRVPLDTPATTAAAGPVAGRPYDVAYARGVMHSRLLAAVSREGDTMALAVIATNATVGAYAKAYQLMSMPASVLLEAADRVLFPSLAAADDGGAGAGKAIGHLAAIVTTIGVVGGASLAVAADSIVALVLGDGWAAAVLPLRVLGLGLHVRLLGKLASTSLLAFGFSVGLARRQWPGAVVTVLGTLVLVPVVGPWGAAAAVIAGFATTTALLLLRLARVVPAFSLRSLARTHVLVSPAVAAILIVGVLTGGLTDVLRFGSIAAAGAALAVGAEVWTKRLRSLDSLALTREAPEP